MPRHMPQGWIHRPVEDEMISVLSKAESGVFLHWGVCGSGKTTLAKKVGAELQNAHGRTVILLSALNLYRRDTPLLDQLKRHMHMPEPTTIILTHFDYANASNEDLMVLASHGHTVLVVMESWERALQLKSAHVLGSPSRWSRAELEELLLTLPNQSLDNEELLHRATISGTPGFLVDSIQMGRIGGLGHAALLNSEWEMGARAFDGSSLPDDKGMFPDKDMSYHWDLVFSAAQPFENTLCPSALFKDHATNK